MRTHGNLVRCKWVQELLTARCLRTKVDDKKSYDNCVECLYVNVSADACALSSLVIMVPLVTCFGEAIGFQTTSLCRTVDSSLRFFAQRTSQLTRPFRECVKASTVWYS